MKKIIRCATVPLSLEIFCQGSLRELSSEYEVIALSSPGPELEKFAAQEGIRTIGVPMSRRISPVGDLVSIVRLTRFFRRERPDMVHSMTPKAGLLCMCAAKLSGVPVRVHTFTGLLFPAEKGLRRFLFKSSDRMIAACATHVIPEGYGVMNDLVSNGIKAPWMQVLGNGNVRGVDLSYYVCSEEVMREGAEIRERFGIPDDGFVFLFVGRFDSDKGLEPLVEAFERLRGEGAGVYLLLVGDEDASGRMLPEALKRKIKEDEGIFVSEGWQKDVRPWFAAADCLVHPSFREGFPNVVLEAGAMDRAAIVTDINGSREIVSDGVNGRIVPPDDAEALYGAMKALSSDRETVDRMADVARKMVADRFEQGYVRSCLKEFYREILEKSA